MKKGLSLILILVMLCSLFAGCNNGGDTAVKSSGDSNDALQSSAGSGAKTKLVVGMMPFGGNVPAQYAYDQGWFEEAGLDVEFAMFAQGAAINEALAAEQVDIAVSGLAMVFSLGSDTCTWIGESNVSGGMGIYVRSDSPILQTKGEITGKPDMYGSAESIKGIKVLGQLGTSSQYTAICYARQFGLTEADIEMVNIDLGTDLQAFITGEGDAFSASRPFSFQAEAEGYICAATFEDSTDIVLHDGIVARNNVLSTKRDAIVSFLREYYRASELMQNDEQLRFDYSKSYFESNGRTYSDDDMKNEIRVNTYVTIDSMTDPSYEFGAAMLRIAEFYSEGGKIPPENLPNVSKSAKAQPSNQTKRLD